MKKKGLNQPRIWQKALIATMLLIAASILAEAKTLYVDTAGGDAVTYAQNDATHPWQTIGRAAWGSTNRAAPNAAEAARAGDTVIVRAGTYTTTGTDTRQTPAYNPINSGTPGNQITFQVEGIVILVYSSGIGPVIGANGKNYITWKGFYINEANALSASDTGPVVLWSTVGSTIEDCVLDGNGDAQGRNDNHPGIRIESCGNDANLVVRNNRIYNFYTQNNPTNGCGVQLYNSGDIIIEHNEFYNSGAALNIKHMELATGTYDIRYNLMYNVNVGIRSALTPNTVDEPVRIYQNIIRDADYLGIQVGHLNGSNVIVANNVIYNASIGFQARRMMQNAANYFWNNIVHNSRSYAVFSEDDLLGMGITKNELDMEHNIYFGFQTFAQIYWVNYAYSNWQSTFGQDLTAVITNPMFVNAAQGDFHLQAGSPARTTGVDILDLDGDGSTTDTIPAGAYITGNEIIGRTNDLAPPHADTTPPSRSNGAPTGTLTAGTTSTTLSLATNEPATCKYSTTPGVAYSSMPGVFTTTGGTTHSRNLTGLVNGQTYQYYIRCYDQAGNVNTQDYQVNFNIAAAQDLPGDINSDRTVNIADLQIIVNDFGKTTGFNPKSDAAAPYNSIDLFDIMVVIRNWGRIG